MSVQLRESDIGGAAESVVVQVIGDVDLSTADRFTVQVHEATSAVCGGGRLVVDLSRADFVGTIGLRILLDVQTWCRSLSVSLRLVGVRPSVSRALDLVGLSDHSAEPTRR